MADDMIPENVDTQINDSLGEDAPAPKPNSKVAPSYKMIGDSKIPVSKANGKIWKSRVAQSNHQTKDIRDVWSEAIRYYENDQTSHRASGVQGSGNVVGNTRLNNNITETENVVFANVTTMVPALYSQNPTGEFTANNKSMAAQATMLERLVNVIGGEKVSPGINLKPKAKRCVVTTLLTNRSWIKIGWTPKSESSDQAIMDLTVLSKELEKAKDPKKIMEIEGKLMALEESVDILQPAGPYCKVKTPFEILVDPNAKEIDLSDANWVIEQDMMPTEYLLARFANKKGGEYRSVYQSTHVMKASVDGDDGHDNDNFSIFDDNKEEMAETAKSFGFDDEESFDKAKMTKVYYVWDKVTRRVLLYNSKDWTWPIWVWDDPLQLDCFFPYYPLTFYESPSGPITKGEVSYYLDQQDGINEIADEKRRSRKWARRNIFFNSNLISLEEAQAVLTGDDGTARGIKLPPETKLMDVIGSIPPPSVQFEKLFDKEDIYRAIDRISSVSTVMRGEQFKTNTNQEAVAANVGASNMRVDEKSDQIEDWIGQIYWGIAQLCLMFMPKEQVMKLIGDDGAQWTNMTRDEVSMISVKVIGGSTRKPTSAAKKQEALELGQVLGQFVNAAPGPVLKVMLQSMEKAFDEITISEEDWQELIAAIEQQNGGGEQAQQPQQPQGGGANVSTASPEQLKEILASLPPELKTQVQSAIKSGVSPKEALQAAIEQSAAQAAQQPATQPPTMQ